MLECINHNPNSGPGSDQCMICGQYASTLRRDVIDLLGRIDAFEVYEMEHPLSGGRAARWERVMAGRDNVRTALGEK